MKNAITYAGILALGLSGYAAADTKPIDSKPRISLMEIAYATIAKEDVGKTVYHKTSITHGGQTYIFVSSSTVVPEKIGMTIIQILFEVQDPDGLREVYVQGFMRSKERKYIVSGNSGNQGIPKEYNLLTTFFYPPEKTRAVIVHAEDMLGNKTDETLTLDDLVKKGRPMERVPCNSEQ